MVQQMRGFMRSQGNLVRKQYLVSEGNVKKLEELASVKGTSAADIVRHAIDAYDPQGAGEMDTPELMALVSQKLKEAVSATRKANRNVAKSLKLLNTEKL